MRAQLLDGERQAGLLETVRHLTLLQIDPTAAIAPNADLVAWSRLGSSYSPAELENALRDRKLLELLAMIRTSEDMTLYRAEMAEWREESRGWQAALDWVRANDACRQDILGRLAATGPLTSRDLPDTCKVPWGSSGWTNNRNVTQLLEYMVRRGEVAVAGRQGRDRLWDLAGRVYPDEPVVPAEEALRIRNERRLRALGIARAQGTDTGSSRPTWGGRRAGRRRGCQGHVAGRSFAAWPAVLGARGAAVAVRPAHPRPQAHGRAFRVRLPTGDVQAGRQAPWGYFALPILYGDRLAGKLDATADRKAGVLQVNAIHQDVTFGKAMTAAVDQEIEDLARWLGLDPMSR